VILEVFIVHMAAKDAVTQEVLLVHTKAAKVSN
jgi:hypothetical protein